MHTTQSYTLDDSHWAHVLLLRYRRLGLVPINKAVEQASGPGTHTVLPGV